MFASNRVVSSANSPMTLSVVGSPVQHTLPGHKPAQPPEGATTTRKLWVAEGQPLNLRRCDDEPALEYGCVDWFLYDKQRPQ
jgi:hypothetical protein